MCGGIWVLALGYGSLGRLLKGVAGICLYMISDVWIVITVTLQYEMGVLSIYSLSLVLGL